MNTINTFHQPQSIQYNSNLYNDKLLQILDIDWDLLKLIPDFDPILIRSWFYSAKYFSNTYNVLKQLDDDKQYVTMQIFQKSPWATIGWVNLVKYLLKVCSGYYLDETMASQLTSTYIQMNSNLDVLRQKLAFDDKYSKDYFEAHFSLMNLKKIIDSNWIYCGDEIDIKVFVQDWQKAQSFEPVMKISWPYKYFAKLESVYLWILARATKVATNTVEVVTASNWKPVMFFADRFDLYSTQNLDGYASMIGWVSWVATDAQWFHSNTPWIWTMPHALIASFGWDTALATYEFAKHNPEAKVISLVDFHNNCSQTSLEVAQYLTQKWIDLYWVRLDTSWSMVDEWLLFKQDYLENLIWKDRAESIREEYNYNKHFNLVSNNSLFSEESLSLLKSVWITWVCQDLVKLVRTKLDSAGYNNVKVFVSGWFNAEKIQLFEDNNIPVDGYGVWSTLLSNKYVTDNWDFTADIVQLNWKPVSKVWRKDLLVDNI